MPLAILTETERRTLDAYVELLRERLGAQLVSVHVFGSVARGESWPRGMPTSPSRATIDRDAIELPLH